MLNISFTISQNQSANVLAQAQIAINLVISALQQVIASATGNTVTLSAALITSILASLNLAASLVAQALVIQQQTASVTVGGAVATGTQQQIIRAISTVQAQLSVIISTFQQLLAQANAMGGTVTVSLSALQQILISLQILVQAIVRIIATQSQVITGSGMI